MNSINMLNLQIGEWRDAKVHSLPLLLGKRVVAECGYIGLLLLNTVLAVGCIFLATMSIVICLVPFFRRSAFKVFKWSGQQIQGSMIMTARLSLNILLNPFLKQLEAKSLPPSPPAPILPSKLTSPKPVAPSLPRPEQPVPSAPPEQPVPSAPPEQPAPPADDPPLPPPEDPVPSAPPSDGEMSEEERQKIEKGCTTFVYQTIIAEENRVLFTALKESEDGAILYLAGVLLLRAIEDLSSVTTDCVGTNLYQAANELVGKGVVEYIEAFKEYYPFAFAVTKENIQQGLETFQEKNTDRMFDKRAKEFVLRELKERGVTKSLHAVMKEVFGYAHGALQDATFSECIRPLTMF